jgi:hypothetical protein
LGDSVVKLPEIIPEINSKAIFWLDGHYSGFGTGKGETNCPVLDELEIIKSSKSNYHVILIDDAREFNGSNGYPNLEIVINKLKEINSDYTISVSFDSIIALTLK